jgi:hypothetical protein
MGPSNESVLFSKSSLSTSYKGTLNKTTKILKVKGKLLGRWKGKRKRGGKTGYEGVTEEVSMIKIHYMHVWKCQDETPYYVQFNIHQ